MDSLYGIKTVCIHNTLIRIIYHHQPKKKEAHYTAMGQHIILYEEDMHPYTCISSATVVCLRVMYNHSSGGYTECISSSYRCGTVYLTYTT